MYIVAIVYLNPGTDHRYDRKFPFLLSFASSEHANILLLSPECLSNKMSIISMLCLYMHKMHTPTHTSTRVHTHTPTHTHTRKHRHTHPHTHPPTHTHTSTRVHTHTPTHTHINTDTHTHPPTHRHTHTPTHVHTHTQTHNHTHPHTYTHRLILAYNTTNTLVHFMICDATNLLPHYFNLKCFCSFLVV